MKIPASLLLAAFAGSAITISAQRHTVSINDGWRFMQGECSTAAEPTFDDSEWSIVHLPHTWNTDAYIVRDYLKGKGWYRRRLQLPASWQGKRIYLDMEGASKAATLWVNGKKAGSHRGGYTASTNTMKWDSATFPT